MLHVRLVVPTDLRAAVLARLDGDRTICNLVVLAAQATRPDGDLLLFDVPVEAANPLLDDLKALDLHRWGTVALHRIDTTLSATADAAEALAPGDPSVAVIWDEVAERLDDEAGLSSSFLVFMLVATLIGAIAVLTDSPVLVIGAMVVGPEFGPLAAMMLAIRRRRVTELRRAATTLSVGFALSGVASVLLTGALRLVGRIPAGYAADTVQFTRFISHPDEFSVLVALLAGAAGVLSLTEDRAGTLVGVLISVTTIPALANAGVALALGDLDETLGALIQLTVNVGCMLLVGVATLLAQERLLRHHGRVPGPAAGPVRNP